MIKDPWTVLDRLWDQWEGDDLAPINCRLDVDPRTLHDLQSDWRQWNNNVQMIGANGDPVMEYRGRFTIIPVRHYDLPDMVAPRAFPVERDLASVSFRVDQRQVGRRTA